jgi:16S rRNA (guanine527-N7)-methyltransferase
MIVSGEDWSEARVFLDSLGVDTGFFSIEAFREETILFLELLLRKNQELNLTGAKDVSTLFWKHFVDSLTLLCFPELGTVMDWGAGGGFPSVPLAIVRKHRRDAEFTYFVDSVGKKVKAVQGFCDELGLDRAIGHIARGEEVLRGQLRGRIETVVMRAVAPPERAVEWVRPVVNQWILLIGPSQAAAWRLLEKKLLTRGMFISSEKQFSLPRGLGDRSLLRISKCST